MRALRPEETPHLSVPGRETFARSLAELRELARELEDCRIWACGGGRDDRRPARRRRGPSGWSDVHAAVYARSGTQLVVVRRLALCAAMVLLAGCGAEAPDLFQKRSGADRNANVTLVVSDGGSVRATAPSIRSTRSCCCARGLARDLGRQGAARARAAARPRLDSAVLGSPRTGHVAFSDRSAGQPKTFFLLAQFTKDVAEDVCGISR